MNPYPAEDRTEGGERPEKPLDDFPRRERRRRISNRKKGYVAGGIFVAWIVFVALWLLFVAGPWGGSFFDNVGVITAAFFIAAGIIGMMFSGEGPEKHKWRIRVSIVAAVALIVFFVLWLPLFAVYFSFYRNAAILFAVFMFFLFLMAATWVTASPVPVLRRRGLSSFGIATIWAVLVFCWLWFYAPALTGNQNVAVGFGAFLLLLFTTIAIGKMSVTVEGEISGYAVLALMVIWMILMVGWFWFLADASNLSSYQNGAIVILSFLVCVALSYLWERRKHKKDIPDQGW